MATTLDDLIELRPTDTLPVLDIPGIFRSLVDYLDDSTNPASGVTVQNPVGIVASFAGATAPTGWLLCDGSSISNVNYPELWAVIGTTFGGTSATNFFLPNLLRKYVLGSGGTKKFTATESSDYDDGGQDSDTEIDTDLGSEGGEEKHTLLRLELPSSGPEAGVQVDLESSAPYGSSGTKVNAVAKGVGKTLAMPYSAPLGTGIGMSLLPPSLVLNYIIKAKP